MSEPATWWKDTVDYTLSHFASIVTAVASFIALFKIRQLHIIINSRLTELLKVTGQRERAEGRAEGKAESDTKKGDA